MCYRKVIQIIFIWNYLWGSNTKSTVAILNCLLARQLCFEDASCSAILEIIPRVCGAEIVACSTVTVTKCQAALRTLQAFPFFKPTCLCREPHVDPDCNFFRDFLFDHPCMFVKEKEKDHYPIDALPTCTHAHFVCQQEPKCIKFYEEFKAHCKVRDNYCRMEDRYKCFESWTNLRRSPMFGCICPNNHMKKRCDRIFSMVNHNPCIASDNTSTSYSIEIGNHVAFKNPLVDATNGLDAHAGFDYISITVLNNRPYSTVHHRPQYPEQEEEVQSVSHLPHSILHASPPDEQRDNFIFQSTCHLAMNSCNDNYHCKRMLAPILLHCDISHCNRNSCMEALQAFYGKPNFHWNFEIAFCICKKTDHKDACLIAQEKLHPICAQRSEETLHPTCLSIADACEENKDCRTRLESYEQSCAVDSVTKKCAGLPSECQKSILSILGTDLRTSCGCKGADTGQVYDCLAWQRLLWVNPCVVEAQKHFHRKKAAELALLTASHSSDTSTISTTTTVRITTSIHVHAVKSQTESSQTANTEIAEFVPPPQAFVPTSTHTASLTTSATTMTTKITTSTRTTTGVPTTTMTTITTTIPPKSCVVQRPQFPDQYINEGTLKRIYHEDEFECSDVCECEIGEKLSCRTICIDRMPCKTEFAFYNHAAPAYQAFRGRCLCYSGRFICMKPLPTDYSLPHGVYLFLGYSEVDERELNKNHTTHLVIIQDVVRVLQNFISEINDTLCTLECYNVTKENVIIVGKLADEVDVSRLTPAEILTREKEECANLLEIVSDRINSKNPDFMSHILLSIFKMAEVEIIPIESTSGGAFSTIKEIKGVFKPYMCRFEANYSQRPYNFKD